MSINDIRIGDAYTSMLLQTAKFAPLLLSGNNRDRMETLHNVQNSLNS